MSRPRLSFPHGDHRRARQGCTCTDCRRALALHQCTGGVSDDELRAVCWCETTIVAVPARDVRRGVTRSCGLAHCNRLQDQHRKAS